jgi:hypothetical protein
MAASTFVQLANAQPSVSPSSGTGMSQSFTVTFNGTYPAFLTFGPSDQTGCTIMINYNQQQIGVRNERIEEGGDWHWGYSWTGPGQEGQASNGQCSVSGQGSSIQINEAILAVTFSGTFRATHPMYVSGDEYSTGDNVGSWKVPYPPPAGLSLSPTSSSASQQTFTAIYTDQEGFADIAVARISFAPSGSPQPQANVCFLEYRRSTQNLLLFADNGVNSTNGTIGSSTTLQNNQCIVNLQNVSSSASGNNLTLTVPVAGRTSFAGQKQVWLGASNATETTGSQFGTWTVPTSSPAQPVSVTPSSGYGPSQTFTAVFTDSLGANDLSTVAIDVAVSTSSFANVCNVHYLRGTNQLRLMNDAGNNWSYGTPGVSGTLENSQCSVNTGGTGVSINGNNLTLTLPLSFKSAFVGSKSIFMYADSPVGSSGWQNRGSWNVTILDIQSVTPATGSGMVQTFTVNATDLNGATDIGTVWLYFPTTFNPNPAGYCQVYYDRALNYVFLMNDAGTAGIPALAGSSAVLTNSRCSLSAAGSYAIGSGNLLTVNFAITFAGASSGVKQIFANVKNANSESGWLNKGSWNVVVPSGDFTISVTPATKAVAQGSSTTYTVTVTTNVPNTLVTLEPAAAPVTLWTVSESPAVSQLWQPTGTAGFKFRSSVTGTIKGIRFYKEGWNNGTHEGALYSAGGALLAQATFTNESPSGWQQVNFATPVAIAANTTYVAALYSSTGFSRTWSYFTSARTSGPLRALAAGEDGANGVFTPNWPLQFPSLANSDAHYWVDVAFLPGGTQPSGAPANTTVTISPAQLNGSGAATVTVGATNVTAPGPYTITVTGTSGPYVHSASVNLTVQAPGGYPIYQTDSLTSVNGANWWLAGAVTPTGNGLTAPDAGGGSLVSKVASPTGNDYETRATVRLTASGGTYTLFGRATSDDRVE